MGTSLFLCAMLSDGLLSESQDQLLRVFTIRVSGEALSYFALL